ncbi:DUF3043 domain-containing protein [Nocardioides seonyuensis]|uniref:DUF3043 domain-containing protein n=1 Tax=Nocardioides seonyuensis TaxID=2518371 RepID=A0A4P7IAS0_9ACTN|nr:DUF3043 domain-containing protein [Nocardioides seonyuensis]QBX54118.1 DUF3043 domain-containing protein [Nocardioides seonyuensis]
MFRRTKSEAPTSAAPATTSTPDRPGAKGRPTPSRKEAEAAARARAKAPRSRKEQMLAQRSARGDSTRRAREGMKAGEERYLLARDKGPVRRFIRDFVDVRFTFIELLVPLLVVSMIMGYSGNDTAARLSNTLLFTTLMLILVDFFFMRFRLRRELARRFPGESTKGSTLYALMRSMQMRFMRLPKAQVKVGQKLPDTYR